MSDSGRHQPPRPAAGGAYGGGGGSGEGGAGEESLCLVRIRGRKFVTATEVRRMLTYADVCGG